MKKWNIYWTFIFIVFLNTKVLFSQEIDFSTYSSIYAVTLSDVTGNDLDFGLIVDVPGETASIDIQNSKILSIEGVNYMDVIVEITASRYLLLNGDGIYDNDENKRINLNLRAAYANLGQNDTRHAKNFLVSGTTASAQFPIRYKGANIPPGPPPTPVFEGYNPSLYNDTAYLYVYPTINLTGSLVSGSYSGNINIEVNYD